MKEKLDSVDFEIIEELKKNPKIKLHILAKRLKQPISTIHFHLKKLEDNGFIKYSVVENLKKLGYNVKARIMVYASPIELRNKHKSQKDLAKEIFKINNVKGVDIITGDGDLLVEVYARNIEDLSKTILDKIQKIEGIKNTKTLITLEEYTTH